MGRGSHGSEARPRSGLDREQYVTSLSELDPITKAQLLAGDWTVRQGGNIFRREWFPLVDAVPPGLRLVRSWDVAATEAKPGRDPDWTVGTLMGRSADGTFYVLDVRRIRARPQGVEALIMQTAELDGRGILILMEQEPGSSGKAVIQHYIGRLAGWPIRGERSTGDKVTRASPLSSQAEAGRVLLMRGAWNSVFLDELEAFPHGSHDDQVDAAAGAFRFLTASVPYNDGSPLIFWPPPEPEPGTQEHHEWQTRQDIANGIVQINGREVRLEDEAADWVTWGRR